MYRLCTIFGSCHRVVIHGRIELRHFNAKLRWEKDITNITSVVFDESLVGYNAITSTAYWFYNCQKLQEFKNIEYLNTGNVTDMSYMFCNCTQLTELDLSTFNTANVTNMDYLFSGCLKLEKIYVNDKWSVEKVAAGSGMFNNCVSLYGGMGSIVSSTDYTFARIDKGASEPGYFTDINAEPQQFRMPYYIINEEGDKVTFYYDEDWKEKGGKPAGTVGTSLPWANVKKASFDLSFSNYNLNSTAKWFYGCKYLQTIDLTNINTTNVTDMSYMFYNCYQLTELDLSTFNTANVTSMSGMFSGCTDLETIIVGERWNIENLQLSDKMFYNCSNIIGGSSTYYDYYHVDGSYAHIDGGPDNPGYLSMVGSEKPNVPYTVLSDDNTKLTFYFGNDKIEKGGVILNKGWYANRENIITVVFDKSFSKCTTITSTANWFHQCGKLQEIKNIQYLNTENVTNMSCMFDSCLVLKNINLSHFNTANVKDMYGMFIDCTSLANLDLSHFNTANVTDMSHMFMNCSSLTNLDLSSFKTDNVTSMYKMFSNCHDLETIYVGDKWNTEKSGWVSSMFEECTNLVGGKGTKFDPSHTDITYARIDGGESDPGYLTYKESAFKLGDANSDQAVDVADVVAIVNYILDEPNDPFVEAAADVNGDGKIDVDDVVAVVNIILDSGQQNAREMMRALKACGFRF